MGSIYKAKKCGLVLVPPAVILVYEDTISNKLRRRSMPVRDFDKDSNVQLAAQDIIKRHKRYLEDVPAVLVEKMLRIIQEHSKGLKLPDAINKVKLEFEVGENEDLNRLGEEELDRKKAVMEHEFSRTRLRPGDPGFEYDKRVEFPVPSQPSDWDENENEEEQGEVLVDDLVEDDENFWD